ncbi:hypothetical protein ACP70R_033041 [Stipagrostis hirtigluma subsp. patula]
MGDTQGVDQIKRFSMISRWIPTNDPSVFATPSDDRQSSSAASAGFIGNATTNETSNYGEDGVNGACAIRPYGVIDPYSDHIGLIRAQAAIGAAEMRHTGHPAAHQVRASGSEIDVELTLRPPTCDQEPQVHPMKRSRGAWTAGDSSAGTGEHLRGVQESAHAMLVPPQFPASPPDDGQCAGADDVRPDALMLLHGTLEEVYKRGTFAMMPGINQQYLMTTLNDGWPRVNDLASKFKFVADATKHVEETDRLRLVAPSQGVWVNIDAPPEVKISGWRLKSELMGQTDLSSDICDAIIHCYCMRELETLRINYNFVPRHFVSTAWAESLSLEDFVSNRADYPVTRSRLVMALYRACSTWSCYAIDFDNNILTIMDPEIHGLKVEPRIKLHREASHRILSSAILCMREVCQSLDLGSGLWQTRLLPTCQRHISSSSTVVTLNCMRWFNGPNMCFTSTEARFNETRKEWAHMLIHSPTNSAYEGIKYGLETLEEILLKPSGEGVPETVQSDMNRPVGGE